MHAAMKKKYPDEMCITYMYVYSAKNGHMYVNTKWIILTLPFPRRWHMTKEKTIHRSPSRLLQAEIIVRFVDDKVRGWVCTRITEYQAFSPPYELAPPPPPYPVSKLSLFLSVPGRAYTDGRKLGGVGGGVVKSYGCEKDRPSRKHSILSAFWPLC
jgi:hypothetical protein